MAKVTDKTIDQVEQELLNGTEVKMIRRRLGKENYCTQQINKIIVDAKEQLKVRVGELKDILPDINLYRLNKLFITSTNASARDRAAIVKEMNTMLGVYNQTVDLDVNFSFIITEDDEVEPEILNG